jgi:hypothetical protein
MPVTAGTLSVTGDGSVKLRVLSVTVAAMAVLTACGGDEPAASGNEASAAEATAPTAPADTMSHGMNEEAMAGMTADVPRVPPMFGYYAGEEIFATHTEISDPAIASRLGGMGSPEPMPVVESLAEVPEEARSPVYVFTNGVVPEDTPSGPLGFAPDVFDSVPGDEDYSPLRELMLVTWSAEDDARVLTSEQEVLDAEAAGEVDIEDTGVVVNMPLLTWPGGQR